MPIEGETTDNTTYCLWCKLARGCRIYHSPVAYPRGQYQGQYYLSSSLNLGDGTRVHPQQVCRRYKTGRSSWCTRWLCHYSEGPWLAGEMGRQESHEFQQREMQSSMSLLLRSTLMTASLLSSSFMAITHKPRKLSSRSLLQVPESLCNWG